MVINSKLIIGHDILKNISLKNQPYRTLYTAPHICGDSFGQTILQSAVFKMAQNSTKPHREYSYIHHFILILIR